MQEIWRDIPGYEGFYQVSNFGEVKSVDAKWSCMHNGKQIFKYRVGRKLKQFPNSRDYLRVGLTKNNRQFVHRLVAQSFIDNPNNKPHINHKDGNPQNNRFDNLEWVTHQENLKYYWDNFANESHRETSRNNGKKLRKYAGQTAKKVNQIDMSTGEIIKTWDSALAAERELGIDNSSIRRVIYGDYRHAGGYLWEDV